MQTCKECKFWTPIEEEPNTGDCFGHKVPGDTPVSACPSQAFQPRAG